jgi:hypothetical protein
VIEVIGVMKGHVTREISVGSWLRQPVEIILIDPKTMMTSAPGMTRSDCDDQVRVLCGFTTLIITQKSTAIHVLQLIAATASGSAWSTSLDC